MIYSKHHLLINWSLANKTSVERIAYRITNRMPVMYFTIF